MDMVSLMAAFCGGAFGACFGALLAFIFIALIGFMGVACGMAGIPYDVMGMLTFGPYYGPHVAFTAAVIASRYAKRQGYIESAKDLTTALISLKKIDVILVGGFAGVCGYLLSHLLGIVFTGLLDIIALTVFLMCLLGKVLFDGTLLGDVPLEHASLGGRFSASIPGQWLPYVSSPGEKVLTGVVVGYGAAFVTLSMLQSQDPKIAAIAVFTPYLLSTFSLIALYSRVSIPVTHHITLCASYGALCGGTLLWGVGAAVLATFLGDWMAQCFLIYEGKRGGSYVDPPAGAIASTSLLLFSAFPFAGFYSGILSTVVPLALVVLPLGWALTAHYSRKISIADESNFQ